MTVHVKYLLLEKDMRTLRTALNVHDILFHQKKLVPPLKFRSYGPSKNILPTLNFYFKNSSQYKLLHKFEN